MRKLAVLVLVMLFVTSGLGNVLGQQQPIEVKSLHKDMMGIEVISGPIGSNDQLPYIAGGSVPANLVPGPLSAEVLNDAHCYALAINNPTTEINIQVGGGVGGGPVPRNAAVYFFHRDGSCFSQAEVNIYPASFADNLIQTPAGYIYVLRGGSWTIQQLPTPSLPGYNENLLAIVVSPNRVDSQEFQENLFTISFSNGMYGTSVTMNALGYNVNVTPNMLTMMEGQQQYCLATAAPPTNTLNGQMIMRDYWSGLDTNTGNLVAKAPDGQPKEADLFLKLASLSYPEMTPKSYFMFDGWQYGITYTVQVPPVIPTINLMNITQKVAFRDETAYNGYGKQMEYSFQDININLNQTKMIDQVAQGPTIYDAQDIALTDPMGMPLLESGFDIKEFRINFNQEMNALVFEIETYGMVGDVDGNGDPNTAGFSSIPGAPPTFSNGLPDEMGIGANEYYGIYLDTNLDGSIDYIAELNNNWVTTYGQSNYTNFIITGNLLTFYVINPGTLPGFNGNDFTADVYAGTTLDPFTGDTSSPNGMLTRINLNGTTPTPPPTPTPTEPPTPPPTPTPTPTPTPLPSPTATLYLVGTDNLYNIDTDPATNLQTVKTLVGGQVPSEMNPNVPLPAGQLAPNPMSETILNDPHIAPIGIACENAQAVTVRINEMVAVDNCGAYVYAFGPNGKPFTNQQLDSVSVYGLTPVPQTNRIQLGRNDEVIVRYHAVQSGISFYNFSLPVYEGVATSPYSNEIMLVVKSGFDASGASVDMTVEGRVGIDIVMMGTVKIIQELPTAVTHIAKGTDMVEGERQIGDPNTVTLTSNITRPWITGNLNNITGHPCAFEAMYSLPVEKVLEFYSGGQKVTDGVAPVYNAADNNSKASFGVWVLPNIPGAPAGNYVSGIKVTDKSIKATQNYNYVLTQDSVVPFTVDDTDFGPAIVMDSKPTNTNSGYEITKVTAQYDATADTITVNLNTSGIIGDVNGDGQKDSAADLANVRYVLMIEPPNKEIQGWIGYIIGPEILDGAGSKDNLPIPASFKVLSDNHNLQVVFSHVSEIPGFLGDRINVVAYAGPNENEPGPALFDYAFNPRMQYQAKAGAQALIPEKVPVALLAGGQSLTLNFNSNIISSLPLNPQMYVFTLKGEGQYFRVRLEGGLGYQPNGSLAPNANDSRLYVFRGDGQGFIYSDLQTIDNLPASVTGYAYANEIGAYGGLGLSMGPRNDGLWSPVPNVDGITCVLVSSNKIDPNVRVHVSTENEHSWIPLPIGVPSTNWILAGNVLNGGDVLDNNSIEWIFNNKVNIYDSLIKNGGCLTIIDLLDNNGVSVGVPNESMIAFFNPPRVYANKYVYSNNLSPFQMKGSLLTGLKPGNYSYKVALRDDKVYYESLVDGQTVVKPYQYEYAQRISMRVDAFDVPTIRPGSTVIQDYENFVQNPDPTARSGDFGFDIKQASFRYDVATNTFVINIETFGVIGDADGDNNPDTTSINPMDGSYIVDEPGIGPNEFYLVYMDVDLDGAIDYTFGINDNHFISSDPDITGSFAIVPSPNGFDPSHQVEITLPGPTSYGIPNLWFTSFNPDNFGIGIVGDSRNDDFVPDMLSKSDQQPPYSTVDKNPRFMVIETVTEQIGGQDVEKLNELDIKSDTRTLPGNNDLLAGGSIDKFIDANNLRPLGFNLNTNFKDVVAYFNKTQDAPAQLDQTAFTAVKKIVNDAHYFVFTLRAVKSLGSEDATISAVTGITGDAQKPAMFILKRDGSGFDSLPANCEGVQLTNGKYAVRYTAGGAALALPIDEGDLGGLLIVAVSPKQEDAGFTVNASVGTKTLSLALKVAKPEYEFNYTAVSGMPDGSSSTPLSEGQSIKLNVRLNTFVDTFGRTRTNAGHGGGVWAYDVQPATTYPDSVPAMLTRIVPEDGDYFTDENGDNKFTVYIPVVVTMPSGNYNCAFKVLDEMLMESGKDYHAQANSDTLNTIGDTRLYVNVIPGKTVDTMVNKPPVPDNMGGDNQPTADAKNDGFDIKDVAFDFKNNQLFFTIKTYGEIGLLDTNIGGDSTLWMNDETSATGIGQHEYYSIYLDINLDTLIDVVAVVNGDGLFAYKWNDASSAPGDAIAGTFLVDGTKIDVTLDGADTLPGFENFNSSKTINIIISAGGDNSPVGKDFEFPRVADAGFNPFVPVKLTNEWRFEGARFIRPLSDSPDEKNFSYQMYLDVANFDGGHTSGNIVVTFDPTIVRCTEANLSNNCGWSANGSSTDLDTANQNGRYVLPVQREYTAGNIPAEQKLKKVVSLKFNLISGEITNSKIMGTITSGQGVGQSSLLVSGTSPEGAEQNDSIMAGANAFNVLPTSICWKDISNFNKGAYNVIMETGELKLAGTELAMDFGDGQQTVWGRSYSSREAGDGYMGKGWSTRFSAKLEATDSTTNPTEFLYTNGKGQMELLIKDSVNPYTGSHGLSSFTGIKSKMIMVEENRSNNVSTMKVFYPQDGVWQYSVLQQGQWSMFAFKDNYSRGILWIEQGDNFHSAVGNDDWPVGYTNGELTIEYPGVNYATQTCLGQYYVGGAEYRFITGFCAYKGSSGYIEKVIPKHVGKITQDMSNPSIWLEYTYKGDLFISAILHQRGENTTLYSCEYDENGRLSKLNNGLGKFVLENQYDSFNRVIKQFTPLNGLNKDENQPRIPDLKITYEWSVSPKVTGINYNKTRTTSTREEFHFSSYINKSYWVEVPGTFPSTGPSLAGVTVGNSKETTAQDIITTNDPDIFGRIIKTINPDGTVLETQYDTLNPDPRFRNDIVSETMRPTAESNEAPIVTSYTYEPKYHKVKTETPPNGKPTTYIYDYEEADHDGVPGLGDLNGDEITNQRLGKVVKIVRPSVTVPFPKDGAVELFRYNESGMLVEQVDPSGMVTRTNYYEEGEAGYPHQKEVIVDYGAGKLNLKTSYVYDDDGRMTSTTDPKGNVTTYEYDNFDRQIRITNALGLVSETGYDSIGRVTETRVQNKDKDGVLDSNMPWIKTKYVYDDISGRLKWTEREKTPGVWIASNGETDYLGDGSVDISRDIFGVQTKMEYDSFGRNHKTTRAYGTTIAATTETIFDSFGRAYQSKDAKGNIPSETFFDAFGRGHMSKDAAGLISKTVYDQYGRPWKQQTFANDDTVETNLLSESVSYYDELGRVFQTQALWKEATGSTPQYIVSSSTEYDILGRVYRTWDANENSSTTYYDSVGRVSKVVNALLQETKYEYDANGNQTKVTDALGHETTYEYDALNRQTAVVDAQGNRTEYYYDSRGNQVEVKDARGNSTYARFDALGRNYESEDAEGNVTKNFYDDGGRLVSTKDERGNETKFEYDELGRRKKVTDPNNKFVEYTYDKNGNQTEFKDRRGNVTTYFYDALNRNDKMCDALHRPVAGQEPVYQMETVFDLLGRQKTVKNARGTMTAFFYDSLSRMTWVTYAYDTPKAHSVLYKYDNNGNKLSEMNALGEKTSYQYDALNRVVKTIDAVGGETITEYNPVGNVNKVQDPLKNVTTYHYDTLNRVEIIDNALVNNFETYAYDVVGNRASVKNANGKFTTFAYFKNNRMKSVTDALNGLTTQTYDATGNMTLARDAEGKETHFTYDKLNREETKTDAIGAVTTKTYDENGNLSTITDDKGNVTTYHYDELNRQYETVYADNTRIVKTFDVNGNVLTTTDQNGTVVTSTYDELDRLMNRAIAPGAGVVGTTAQTFDYDLIGRLKFATDNNYADTTTDDSKVEYEYDPMGRVFTEKQTIATTSHTVTHQYDYLNEKKQYYPGGKTLDFLHDGLNRVIGINDRQGFVAGYGYTATGRVSGKFLGNGTEEANTFNDLDRITERKVTSKQQSNATVHTLSHSFDKVGNKRFEKMTFGTVSKGQFYTYDDIYRLTNIKYGVPGTELDNFKTSATIPTTKERETTFNMDKVGNRNQVTTEKTGDTPKTTAYATNNMNEYTHVDGVAQTNDEAGNLAQDATRIYKWDFANRLREVYRKSDNALIVKYIYDVQGRRIGKIAGTTTVTSPLLKEHGKPAKGGINISPSNDVAYKFELNMQDGSFFDRNTLKQNAPVNAQGVLVEGLAKRVYFCPKGNGGANTMLVDGQLYPVENGLTYQVTSHYLHVKVYNDNIKNGKAMGKWWIEVDTQRANIEVMGDTVPEPPVTELPTPPVVELPADQTTYTVTQNTSENTLTQQILTNEDRMAEIIAILKTAGVDVSTSPLSMPSSMLSRGKTCLARVESASSSLTQAEIDALLAELAQLQTTTTTLETQLAVVQNTLKTVYYVHDGNRIVEERDDQDHLVSSYVYGNGIDEVVEMMRFGERYYYQLNTLGTVYALTDNAGNVVERYEYDAYGKVTIYDANMTVTRSYSIVGNIYAFTGRQFDYETGLYYYRARMYDPETGRFLSHDISEYEDGMSLFEYVNNQPIDYVDPLGDKKDAPNPFNSKPVDPNPNNSFYDEMKRKDLKKGEEIVSKDIYDVLIPPMIEQLKKEGIQIVVHNDAGQLISLKKTEVLEKALVDKSANGGPVIYIGHNYTLAQAFELNIATYSPFTVLRLRDKEYNYCTDCGADNTNKEKCPKNENKTDHHFITVKVEKGKVAPKDIKDPQKRPVYVVTCWEEKLISYLDTKVLNTPAEKINVFSKAAGFIPQEITKILGTGGDLYIESLRILVKHKKKIHGKHKFIMTGSASSKNRKIWDPAEYKIEGGKINIKNKEGKVSQIPAREIEIEFKPFGMSTVYYNVLVDIYNNRELYKKNPRPRIDVYFSDVK